MSSSSEKYDVFISFRGEDTRTGFTSHLVTALDEKDIYAFIDDEGLQKGEEIRPSLIEAIQDSHISIVVFSVNYATSKWCLDELRQIQRCRKDHGQLVIPVFYKIDPSHVRRQTDSYKTTFTKHEGDLGNNESDQEKVSQWRDALTETANISGWDSRNYKDDSQVIENIVNDVLDKLPLKYPNVRKDLVEIDENRRYIESLLNEFPRIGIWGMGGIGKTTIAKEMFAKHFAQYDSVCFLENVREQSEKFGLTFVRNKLFSELLKRQITTSHVLGPTFIQRRLSSKKVFIVLDDVNDAAELEYLCGELGDLGPNSRLIITTRDRHTLSKRVDKIYEVHEWKFPESLKLFSLLAFDQTHPEEGYEHMSERVVAYAGGIPLALNVLGLHFRVRNTAFWISELNSLENQEESLDNIHKVLQMSYNGLRKRERVVFLDIAFFLKDENIDFVIRILDACGFNATSAIEILKDKALITISNRKRIQMHDLIQKMAFHIVKEESSSPGKRSRLKNIEEVCYVFRNSKGTDAVEGITSDLSQRVDLHLQADTFNMMDKLRCLRLHVPLGKNRSVNVYHLGSLERCSDELRYLEWDGYPLESLPSKFCAKFLVHICMPYSHIKELWQGTQDLVNLEKIDLSECQQLTGLPDLSRAFKLKWVYLSGCESLCDVHPSLLSVNTLEILILNGCKKLKSLIGGKHLRFLQKLNVDDCSSLEEFSVSSDLIERLDLSTTGIKILHSSIGLLQKLKRLNLQGLSLLNLPDELSQLRSLEELWISKCRLVNKEKLQVLCDGIFFLKLLHLKDCDMLFKLPNNISGLSLLYELRLDGSSVEKLPASIKDLKVLEILSLENCSKLGSLPKLPPSINELYAINCTSLVTISTLNTFSVLMKGNKKHISFKNGMKLNERSLLRIMEDTLFTMKSAALHNVFVRTSTSSYDYNSVGVCLPGSSVPKHFVYQTTESSITIELPGPDQSSHLIGFIYSVVLSPSPVIEQCYAKIQCLKDGRKLGNATTWHHNAIGDLHFDHVFVWYDPFHSDLILNRRGQNKRFELRVTIDSGEREGLTHMKEFGVHPIRISNLEFQSCVREAVALKLKMAWVWLLGLKFQLAMDLLNGYDRVKASKFCLAWENGYEVDASLKSDLDLRMSALIKKTDDMGFQIQNQEQNLSDCIPGENWRRQSSSQMERERSRDSARQVSKENKAKVIGGLLEKEPALKEIHSTIPLPNLQALQLRLLPIRAPLLVEIHMPHNNVKELWQGIQELHNLKRFDISECKQLVRLPDLSKASRLEWFDLSGCESLCCLPDLTMAPRLQWVDISGCKRVHPLISEEGVELESGRSTALTLIETPQEEETPHEEESCGMRNQIQNQRWDSREQSASDSMDESDSEMVEPDSGEEGNERKDHYSEGIKSPRKKTKTGRGQISITESINVVDFIRRLCNLPPLQALGLDELWCFITSGRPLRSLPSAIRATLLVEIRMPHNNIKELWQGIQELHNFKRFDLSECEQLVRLPDLSKASRLEWLNLSGCKSLCYLHPFDIKCQCRLKEGTRATLLSTDIKELNWDPFRCDSILKCHEPTVCSEFCVANATKEVDGSVCIKECGVSDLELQSVLAELDLDFEKKKYLEKGVELESGRSTTLTSIETSDEEESYGMRNQIQNQRWDSREQSSSDSIDESSSEMVEPDSNEEGNGWKDHYSNMKEGIKSTCKETKTGAEKGRKHITITKSTNADFKPLVEGDAHDMTTSSRLVEDASIMPNFPLPKSIIDLAAITTITQKGVEDSKEKETGKASPIGEAQLVLRASTSSLSKEKEEVSSISCAEESIPMDLDYINKLIHEDPIGAMESFLSGKISVSSKTQQSTTHNEVQKVDSAPWNKLIDNLRDLAFDSNLFHLLHNDILSNEIKDLLKQIEKYIDKMPEDLVFEVKKFNDFYTDVLQNIRECNECVEEQKKIGASHQTVLEQMKNSKADFEKVTTLIDLSSVKLTSINDQVVELERKLAEAKREQSLLISTMDKCGKQKKDVIMKSASLSHEAKNLMVRMQKAEAAQQTFDEVHQKHSNIYKKMRANPPF